MEFKRLPKPAKASRCFSLLPCLFSQGITMCAEATEERYLYTEGKLFFFWFFLYFLVLSGLTQHATFAIAHPPS